MINPDSTLGKMIEASKEDAKHEETMKAYRECAELLGTVLSVIQIGLLRGQFAGMADLENFTSAMDKFTHHHSRILNKIRSNNVAK